MMNFKVIVTPRLQKISITELSLSTRTENALKRSRIFTVGDLFENHKTTASISNIHNLGEKSVDELIIAIVDKMCSFMTDEEKTEYAKTLAEINS